MQSGLCHGRGLARTASQQHSLQLYSVLPVLPDPPKPSRPILPKTTAGLDPFTAGKIFLHYRFHGRFIFSFSMKKKTHIKAFKSHSYACLTGAGFELFGRGHGHLATLCERHCSMPAGPVRQGEPAPIGRLSLCFAYRRRKK